MGGWTMRVYTEEQQKRLNVDETGVARPGVEEPKDTNGTDEEQATSEGAMDEDAMEDTPAWIVGDIEEPQGEKDMGGWTMRAYTKEQQERLNVDETGEAKPGVGEPKDTNATDEEQGTSEGAMGEDA